MCSAIFSGTPEQAECQLLPLFQIECIPDCSPGSFFDRGQGYCTQCEQGTYSKITGATACRMCPPGTASASQGATTCTDCQPGSYSTWGSAECLLCDRHTYSDHPKAVSCSICPTGKYANTPGRTACNSGPYCKAGFSTKMTQLHGDPRGLCPEDYVLQYEEPPCIYDPEFYIELVAPHPSHLSPRFPHPIVTTLPCLPTLRLSPPSLTHSAARTLHSMPASAEVC